LEVLASWKELGDLSRGFGNPLDEPDREGTGTENGDQEDRQEAMNNLRRNVHEQRHEPERNDCVRYALYGGKGRCLGLFPDSHLFASRNSHHETGEASRHQEADPGHRTDEVEIMSWAVWQAPSHAGQDINPFRDMS
jgi:hypothetical protein